MPMLDESGLADLFTPWLLGQPTAMPDVNPAKGEMQAYSPAARIDRAFSALPPQPAPVAPPLPAPVDIASRPVAAVNSGPVASPFDLGVGQSAQLEDARLPANAT